MSKVSRRWIPFAVVAFLLSAMIPDLRADEPLKIGRFEIDASPPIGSPMAYDPTKEIEVPLTCRGIVILGQGTPIVMCSIDWIGIANESHQEFRTIVAKEVGTTPERVAVHAIHQHDAPRGDLTTDKLCRENNLTAIPYDSNFARQVMERTAVAAAEAKNTATVVTHLGTGKAIVEKVASNRRILGDDGKVLHVRWSATKDEAVREFPEGVIDPYVRIISFWNGDKPIVALSYYTTHPQSYYRTGKANPDFPGYARNACQKTFGIPLIHFNGASGNVTAGKYNDGNPANRQILADRLARGMEQAWTNTKRVPVHAADVEWRHVPVRLPPASHFVEEDLRKTLADTSKSAAARETAALNLAYVSRYKTGVPIELTCLKVGPAKILHMPGELFVEYQLEAARLDADSFVTMAAYGEYGTGYIGTEIAYSQGGYEVGPNASRVSPAAEKVLMAGIAKLLGVSSDQIVPLR